MPDQEKVFVRRVGEGEPVERSGHTPLITQPRKFSQEIGKFLENQSQ